MAELRKVVWPTRSSSITYFVVVMIFVVIMITIVSVLDLVLGKPAFEIFNGGRRATTPYDPEPASAGRTATRAAE